MATCARERVSRTVFSGHPSDERVVGFLTITPSRFGGRAAGPCEGALALSPMRLRTPLLLRLQRPPIPPLSALGGEDGVDTFLAWSEHLAVAERVELRRRPATSWRRISPFDDD